MNYTSSSLDIDVSFSKDIYLYWNLTSIVINKNNLDKIILNYTTSS